MEILVSLLLVLLTVAVPVAVPVALLVTWARPTPARKAIRVPR